MRLKVLLAFTLSVIILASACSTRQEFIIVNETDADLIIQYSYIDKARIIYKPRVTAADKADDPGKKWREIPTKFFDVDPDTRVVSVKVDPLEALLLKTAENYEGPGSEDFPINMISLTGKTGNKLFENETVETAFKKQENGNYVIFYK